MHLAIYYATTRTSYKLSPLNYRETKVFVKQMLDNYKTNIARQRLGK